MSSADFTCIRIVGGLLPPDLLGRILSGDKDLGGLTPSDYHLPSGETPKEAANRAWGYLLGAWSAYRQALAKLPEGDPAVGVTRERWLTVVFKELGYGRLQQTPAGGLHADDKAFPVSHLWGAAPLHLLGWGVELDRRTKGVPGAADRAPQAMLQELLNRNHDYLWAMLSNGRTLRLLRDSTSLAGQSYVEFDLESMFDGEVFSDFALMFVMLHQSRVEVPEGGVPSDCWLERWRTSAAESGTRALGLLRDGVKDAIEALGTGFLQSPGNNLGVRISDGELRLEDYHRSLLRLVYRLLFLFVAEDRGLLQDPAADQVALQRYRDYFSTGRLRALARKRRGARHTDLWQGLQLVISGLGDERGLPELGLPGLGGIFNHEPIDVVIGQRLPNEALLTAIRRLSVVQPKNSPPRIVDYRNLGAEELGSIYESLLELVPRHDRLGRIFTLENLAGNDRKTSGSYYTPTSLIDLVLDQALDPLLDEAEKEKDPEQALLAMTICDPACGSGHFLVAAARRIASRLATVRTGELDPTPADVHEALHDVVARCIYGIDLNPMAAELAKVSLWLEAMQEGRPLSFLDAHIKVGNALLGVTPRLLEEGLPDAAFVALTGDDKAWTSSLKKRNKAEREQADQGELFTTGGLHATNTDLATKVAKVDTGAAPSLADAHQQAQRFRDLQTDPDYARARQVADAWCAAFVQPKRQGDPAITHSTLQTLQDDPGSVDPAVIATIEREAIDYRFFHWHLEFPQVFRVDHAAGADPASGWSGGFTAMLGNPPWDILQMSEQEFFATRDDEITLAPNAAKRRRLIEALADSNPALYSEYRRSLRWGEGQTHMIRGTGRFPLTAQGKINTYSIFAESFRNGIEPEGQCGIITPTGLATDATTADFFSDTLRSGRLGGFTDFENSQPMFEGVHRSFRFAVTCMTGRDRVAERVPLAFMLYDPSQALMARFELSNEEILLLNPNTGTLPVFASRKDAEITLKIYRRFPVLIKDGDPDGNPWGLKFKQGLFNMSSDSHLFRTREELEAEGYVLQGNVFVHPDSLSLSLSLSLGTATRYLPLYEAKMMNLYDHRFATYEGATGMSLPAVTDAQHDDASYEPLPRYWVAEEEVEAALGDGWDSEHLFGWRKITRNTDARTFITGAVPRSGAGDSLMLARHQTGSANTMQAAWSSLAMDYQLRQKLSGTNFQFFIIKQLACPPPRAFDATPSWLDQPLSEWLTPRVLELTFTTHSLASLARESGDDRAPFRWAPPRRQQIRAELDAAMFHVFGLDRDEVEHVLGTFTVMNKYDMAEYGDLRTTSLVLTYYDRMAAASHSGEPYETAIEPASGHGPRHESAVTR